MTTPTPTPTPRPETSMTAAYEFANRPTWCTACQVHQATEGKPLCPVCLDDLRRLEVAS